MAFGKKDAVDTAPVTVKENAPVEAPAEKADSGLSLKVLDAIQALTERVEKLEGVRPAGAVGKNPIVELYRDKNVKVEAIKIFRAGSIVLVNGQGVFCPGVAPTENHVGDGCIVGLELDRTMPQRRL